MIVVSGELRSGTSLQMLLIRELGFKITGVKSPSKAKGLGKKMRKRDQKSNPTGFWEIPDVVRYGIPPGYRLVGEAVKLLRQGLLTATPSRLIYCIRDPREMVVSNITADSRITPEMVYNKYIKWTKLHLELNPMGWDKTHVVDYSDVQSQPEREVRRLAAYLGAEYKPNALKRIKPELYRSSVEGVSKDDEAHALYNQLKEIKNEES